MERETSNAPAELATVAADACADRKRNPTWISRTILVVIVGMFLVLIGGGVHNKIVRAVAPPIYDPVTFYYRSQQVWQAVAKRDFKGIFNGYLAFRPPGTAFLLYPLGFKSSIHSFLFRVVFVPILIWAIGLIIVVSREVRTRQDAVLGGALCLGLLSLPLFYHFEANAAFLSVYKVFDLQWGLVDALQASVAALATVLVCLGVEKRKLTFCTLGWFLALLSFYVKPSGIVVIGVIAIIGTIELLIRAAQDRDGRRELMVFGLQFLGIGLGLAAVGLFVALKTDYMNRGVIAAAVKAQKILIATTSSTGPTQLLGRFVRPGIGWWWFCPGVILIGFALYRAILSRKHLSLGLRLGGAILILALTIIWWLYFAGPEQRYLFPFLLMLVAWFTPGLFLWLKRLPAALRIASGVYCLVPPLLLVLMLYLEQPPFTLQTFLGVNLSTGGYSEEVQEGNWLSSECAQIHRPLVLYFCGQWRVGVVEMVAWMRCVTGGAKYGFKVRRALNWVEEPGLRIKDLLDCDYILLEDIPPAQSDNGPVDSWELELERFKSFAYRQRGPDINGLVLVSDGSLKILRVANLERFKESLRAWAKSIQWKDDFLARNAGALAGI